MSSNLSAVSQRYVDAESDADKKAAVLALEEAFQLTLSEIANKTNTAESLEDEVSSLEAELSKLLAEEESAEGSIAAPSAESAPLCTNYYAFLAQRSRVLGEFQVLEAALRCVAEGEGARIQGQWAASDAFGQDSWSSKREALIAKVAQTKDAQTAVESTLKDADTNTDVLKVLLSSIESFQPAAVAAVDAFAARNDGTKATRAEMEVERTALLTWCRQQKTNLDAMVEPDHAQEFCSSLLANFASMDKNFQVLLDFTNQLPGDEALQKDMLECNEVWLNLQVSAYERMRHALLEVHPKSKLEDEVREFVSFTEEVLDFIKKVRELFSNTSDPESDRFVRPVIEEADMLLSEYGMHERLPKQLQEFCNRMDCLRDSYSNLRRAVLSRLTFLTSSVPALTASMRRKEEYVARMRDLKSWVEVKSQGETWSDIHERILSIKALIEQEQASLSETKVV